MRPLPFRLAPALRPVPGHHAVATALVLASLFLAACGGVRAPDAGAGVGERLQVVATTTVLADMVEQVGGDHVDVRSLVPRGGEVHTFDPSPRDVAAVADADLVVLNGLGLDAWAADLVAGAGATAPVIELGEDLDGVEYIAAREHGDADQGDETTDEHGDEAVNPHLWLNVAYAARYVERISDALADVDPGRAETIRAAAAAYREQLAQLDTRIREQIAGIPEDRRRIVSFHEAFPYFAAAYDLEVVGVVVEAPGQDPSAGEITELVAAIRESGARAVFTEAQFDDRLARTVAEEADVTVEPGLYNDSLGDPPADTYVGMMELNAEQIVAALR